jgi:hypothetical protein
MQTQGSMERSSADKDVIDRLERLFLLDDAVPRRQGMETSRHSFWMGVGLTSVTALSLYLVSQNAPNIDRFWRNAQTETTRTVEKTVTKVIPLQFTSGLSATRTTLTGVVDPDSMTAAYYLSTVLKNSSASNQEAQMKIILPAGAAVTRATLWINGQPQEAAFSKATLAQQAFDWVVQGRRDPLLVKQINENTIQVTASPVVPGGDGMKIRIGITAPLRLLDTGQVSAQLPLIKDLNFADGKYDVHLESSTAILSSTDSVTKDGKTNILRRNLNSLEESQPRIAFSRNQSATTFATRATHSLDGGFIVASWAKDPASDAMKLSLKRQIAKPAADVPILKSDDAATRLSTLWAKVEIQSLVSAGDSDSAVRIANVYRVVSPVSSAVVLETQGDYDRFALNRDQWQSMVSRQAQGRRRSDKSPQRQPDPMPQPVPVPLPMAAPTVVVGRLNSQAAPSPAPMPSLPMSGPSGGGGGTFSDGFRGGGAMSPHHLRRTQFYPVPPMAPSHRRQTSWCPTLKRRMRLRSRASTLQAVCVWTTWLLYLPRWQWCFCWLLGF